MENRTESEMYKHHPAVQRAGSACPCNNRRVQPDQGGGLHQATNSSIPTHSKLCTRTDEPGNENMPISTGRSFQYTPCIRIDIPDCGHDLVETLDGWGVRCYEKKTVEGFVKVRFHIFHDVIVFFKMLRKFFIMLRIST